jgi:AcrR family transcriptional regulator
VRRSTAPAPVASVAGPGALEPARLARGDRHDALLDAAAALVAAGDVEAVTMEAVAERAGVSRPLVYKHFANRGEVLAAVYGRESALLRHELAAEVNAAGSLEDMFRALIRGALRAQASRGATFAALRSFGLRSPDRREDRRRRDRTTVRYFASHAVRQFGFEEREAKEAVAIVLSAMSTVLVQWNLRPTTEHAQSLEDTYVAIVMGGLAELARRNDRTSREDQ